MSNVNARSAEKSKFIKNQSIGWNQFFDYRCFDTIFINISFFRNRFQSINVNFEIQKNVHLQFFFCINQFFCIIQCCHQWKFQKLSTQKIGKFISSPLHCSSVDIVHLASKSWNIFQIWLKNFYVYKLLMM